MKAINKIFLGAGILAASLSMGSCINDLDLTPTDPSTMLPTDFASDPDKYMDELMGDVYLQFNTAGVNGKTPITGMGDDGMAVFQRVLFCLEETCTDEASWLATNDVVYTGLQYGVTTPQLPIILAGYSRLTVNVALCNDFIQTVQNGYFGLSTDEQRAKADEYMRQCRILRAACYFYLVDLFGNVPYADDNVEMGAMAPQLPRAEVFDLVTSELEGIVAEYNGNNKVAYGYVGLDVAEALLVKFYLNAEVYTGTAQWSKCFNHAQNIIRRHQGKGFDNSGLAKTYIGLFAANNEQYVLGKGDVAEILWSLPAEDPKLLSWGNGTVLLSGWLDSNGAPGGDYYDVNGTKYNRWNYNDGWKCIAARQQFVEKMEWKDAAMSESDDERVSLWVTSKDGFSAANPVLNQDYWGKNGYLAVKFNNFVMNTDGTIDFANSPAAANQSYSDYPMIRLAEIYLSAAEAAINGGGSRADALEYVNLIRRRAGLSKWSDGQLTAESLQDERCRELYTENCRRTDLIRYNKWISGYTWNWKNNVPQGSDFPAHYNLYPLPTNYVTNAYQQNPGY